MSSSDSPSPEPASKDESSKRVAQPPPLPAGSSLPAATKKALGSGQSLLQQTQSAGRLAMISAEKAKVLNVDVPRL